MNNLKITLHVMTGSAGFHIDPNYALWEILGQFADRAMRPSFKEGFSCALLDADGHNVGSAVVEALLPEDKS